MALHESHTATRDVKIQPGVSGAWSGLAWAALGFVLLMYAVFGWTQWITSEHFTPAPVGPDEFPFANLIALRMLEVVSVVGCALVMWFIVIRPWRETGQPSFPGILVLGAFPAVFWDQTVSYRHFTGAFNAYAVQFGGWGSFIAGAATDTHTGEPLLWTVPQFVIGPAVALLGVVYIEWLRKRRPGISNLAAFLALLPLACLLSFVMEVGILFRLTQAGAYVRTWESLTLWAGTQYQFPLYEPLFFSTWVFGFVYLHLTYRDRGTTFLHKGLERIQHPGTRTAVLFLASAGFQSVWCVAAYFGPWALQAVHADSVLTNLPSYLQPIPHVP